MKNRSPVKFLSESQTVDMDEQWFSIATLDHFWIKRRFDVIKKIFSDTIMDATCIGEVGAGNGLVQREIEIDFDKPVEGFDLDADALENSYAEKSLRYVYNIFEKQNAFKEKYDLLILCDVIEHLPDDEAFLEAALFHVKPGGCCLINVPALKSLYSRYDSGVGHHRRYNGKDFERLAQATSTKIEEWSYWGAPMLPILVLRKIWLAIRRPKNIAKEGFSTRGALMNNLLYLLAKCERCPQRYMGTSVTVLLRKS